MKCLIEPSIEFFGFGKKKDDDKEKDSYLYLSDEDVDAILDAIDELSEDEWGKFLENTNVSIVSSQEFKRCATGGALKLLSVIKSKLIPAWEKIKTFHWHNEDENPVDYDTKTIKVPGLQTAVTAAGKIATDIMATQEYQNAVDYKGIARNKASLKDNGYSKADVIAVLKAACLHVEYFENDFTKIKSYVQSEDHSDGWQYIVNHIFDEYYDNPSAWPDIKSGETIFLTEWAALDELDKDCGRLLRKFAAFCNVQLSDD